MKLDHVLALDGPKSTIKFFGHDITIHMLRQTRDRLEFLLLWLLFYWQLLKIIEEGQMLFIKKFNVDFEYFLFVGNISAIQKYCEFCILCADFIGDGLDSSPSRT